MVNKAKLKFMVVMAMASFLLAGAHPVMFPGMTSVQADPLPRDGVIIYQFHRRFRCDACYKLEEAINEGLKTHFPEELKTGKLVYRVLDLDAPGTEKFEKKYDFFYNTVIVVDVENGKEIRFKNLEDVWGMVEEKETVIKFIRAHVEEYL
jgi:hypothetical protein